MTRIAIKASGTTAEVLIYEDIGESWWGGVSAKRFAEDLKALGNLTEINVRINSAGGDVFEGLAIYNTLLRHNAKVTVDVDGLAASIASVIAMAGDEVRMAENAMLMIHDPWSVAMGGAADFRAMADVLDKCKDSIVMTYQAKSKLDAAELAALMAAETWLSASEAKEKGFADSITGPMNLSNHLDVARFKNAPQAWSARQRPADSQRQPPAAWRLAAAARELQILRMAG